MIGTSNVTSTTTNTTTAATESPEDRSTADLMGLVGSGVGVLICLLALLLFILRKKLKRQRLEASESSCDSKRHSIIENGTVIDSSKPFVTRKKDLEPQFQNNEKEPTLQKELVANVESKLSDAYRQNALLQFIHPCETGIIVEREVDTRHVCKKDVSILLGAQDENSVTNAEQSSPSQSPELIDEANPSKNSISDKRSNNNEESIQVKSPENNAECSLQAATVTGALSRESITEGSQTNSQRTERGVILSSCATQVQQNMQQLKLHGNIRIRGKSKSLNLKPTWMKHGKYNRKWRFHSERRPTKDQQIALKVFLHLRQSLTAVPGWRFVFRDLFGRASLTNADGLIKETEDKYHGNIQEQIYELLVRWNQRFRAPWTDKLKMIIETLNEHMIHDSAEEIDKLVNNLETHANTIRWTGDGEEHGANTDESYVLSYNPPCPQRENIAYPVYGASYLQSISDVHTTCPEVSTTHCQIESSYIEMPGAVQGETQVDPHGVQAMHLVTSEPQECLPATSISQLHNITRKRKSSFQLNIPSSRRRRCDADMFILQSSSSDESFLSDEESVRVAYVGRKLKKASRRRLYFPDKSHDIACQTPNTRGQFTRGTMAVHSIDVACQTCQTPDISNQFTTRTMADDCAEDNKTTPEASTNSTNLNAAITTEFPLTSETRREKTSVDSEETKMHDKGVERGNGEPASLTAKILDDMSKELGCSVDDVMRLRIADIIDAKQMTGRNQTICYVIDISSCSPDVPCGIISKATWKIVSRLISDRKRNYNEAKTMQHTEKIPEDCLLADVLKPEIQVTRPEELQETVSTPELASSRAHKRRHFSTGAADVILKHFSQYIYETQRITQEDVRKKLSESKSLRQCLSIKNPESNDTEVRKEIKKITDRIWTFIKKERKEIPMVVE